VIFTGEGGEWEAKRREGGGAGGESEKVERRRRIEEKRGGGGEGSFRPATFSHALFSRAAIFFVGPSASFLPPLLHWY